MAMRETRRAAAAAQRLHCTSNPALDQQNRLPMLKLEMEHGCVVLSGALFKPHHATAPRRRQIAAHAKIREQREDAEGDEGYDPQYETAATVR